MKHFKTFALIGGAAAIGIVGGSFFGAHLMSDPHRAAAIVNAIHDLPETAKLDASFFVPYNEKSLSGNYLASRHAQANHDWELANTYLDNILDHDPDNLMHLKRAMVIAIGSGDYSDAFRYAKDIHEQESDHALALMFLAVQAFENGDFEQSRDYTSKMPDGGMTDFIKPLLVGWNGAASGVLNIDSLNYNSVHLYHAVLIADYLDQPETVKTLLERIMISGNVTPGETARIADIYAHIGEKEKALKIYQTLANLIGQTEEITARIDVVKADKKPESLVDIQNVRQGLAQSMVDMSQILFQDYSDDSARIFAHLGLSLDRDLTEAKMLLADITARHDQHDEATAYYQSIPTSDDQYIEAQRKAAELLESMGQSDKAQTLLSKLVVEHDDFLSQIMIGDLLRNNENFEDSIDAYNKAVEMLGGEISEEYWHIHYRRGMAFERSDQWEKAEKDLLQAIEYRPEDPYILNYLAYSWADQGIKLEPALDMLRKAFALRPADGYISDSLGWVLYRMGRTDEALPYLEKAVELLPYDPTINDHLGDAYWHSGRKLEARFQWQRALNNSDENTVVADIEEKLEQGLPAQEILHDKTQNAHRNAAPINSTLKTDHGANIHNGS